MVRNTLRSTGFFLGVLVLLSTVLWTIGLWTTGADVYAQTDVLFRRGDGNHDGSVNVADPIFLLGCQFRGTECSACEDAADANDDRRVDVSDTVYLFLWLFEGGGAPPLPGAFECGLDPSDDSLAKCVYPICGPTGVTRVDVSLTQFDFGERMRGTTALGSVLVSNTGDAPVTLTGASTSAPFTVEELTGLSILNPGETLQLTIEFTPSTAGSFQRVLTVSFGDVDDIEATLSGTGTDSTPLEPGFSPTVIDFGEQTVTTESVRIVGIFNEMTGPQDPRPPAFTLTGATTSPPFDVQGFDLPQLFAFHLPLHGAEFVNRPHWIVTFRPTASGKVEAPLTLTFEDS